MTSPLHDQLRALNINLNPAHKRDRVWLKRFEMNALPNAVPSPFLQRVKPGEKIRLVLPPSLSRESLFSIRLEIGEEAVVTLIDPMTPPMNPVRFVHVEIGARASVRWLGVQQNDLSSTTFNSKRFSLAEGARLDYFHHVLGGRLSYDETTIDLNGAKSSAHSQTVFFGLDRQEQDMRVTHCHSGRDTVSRMVSKGAVKDQAHGFFWGMIRMEPGCDGADGYLEEHNLLLSDRAKIDAVPGLEIGHHNVKAGHAATMERVDEEKLFYLASRGIPKEEGMKLIVEGFFKDAIDKTQNEAFAKTIFDTILKAL